MPVKKKYKKVFVNFFVFYFKKMPSKFFFHNDNALDNLKLLYTNVENNDLFNIKINGFDCFLPLEISVSISTTIAKLLLNDFTQRELCINIEFLHEDSLYLILTILQNIQKTYENTLFDDKNILFDLAEFGFAIGNSSFIQPMIDIYSKNIELEKMPINELIQRIDYKKILSKYLKQEEVSFDDEINFISKNFYTLSKDEAFINWCKDVNNITILKEILSNRNLVILSEDSLLLFLLKLCKENQLYHQLFSLVLIEYCSLECVNTFVKYVNQYFNSSKICHSDYSIIECLSKRCKYNLLDIPSKDFKRYKKLYKITKTYQYQENDVRNGILFNENKRENVLITPSSNNNENLENFNPLYLLEMLSNYSFYTKNIENSSITFLLKDKTPFVINKYMIRGNWNSEYSNQMMSWKLEGQLASNKDWVSLDLKRDEEPLDKYQIRLFSIPQSEPLISVKLTQIAPNFSGNHNLAISSFEIYGDIISFI